MTTGKWWTAAIMMVSTLSSGTLAQQSETQLRDQLAKTPLNRTAEQLEKDTQANLDRADALRKQILAVQGPRTIENTLVPANEMGTLLDNAYNESGLFANTHPDEKVRSAGEACEAKIVQYVTDLALDRGLYEAYKAVDVSKADAATQYMMFKSLRDFRRSGVDKPDDVRDKIKALNNDIVTIGQDFGRNNREDVREILLDSVADLEGMPEDWIASHQPGKDGKIHVNTDYPDYIPFMSYARNMKARKDLYILSKNRGYPANMDVLKNLITKRHELATTLGYPNWAEYITEDKMIGSAANAAAFIDKISAAAKPAVDRDYKVLLERKKKDDPSATKVEDFEKVLYQELVKAEQYNFDSKEVRPYFEFARVRKGLMDITSKMFGLEYRQVEGLPLWHEDVTAYDMLQDGRLIGRFYLDLHPRDGKYKHAACFGYRNGVEGYQLPQSVLVCNFPDPRKSEGPALMDHDEVKTFFHEFGHLIHALLGGHQKWVGISGITTEHDFVEAPSQMLEEWVWDPAVLQLFATHHETNQPIPADLVKRMKRAEDFGKGLDTAHQMFYAAISLNYYNSDPARLDTDAVLTAMQSKYSPFDHVPDTHFQCNFGHLDGYSAVYYTYMWSLVIAKDLFSEFDKNGIMDTKTAIRYRQAILAPGGSKKAADLVKDFLGREYSFDAYLKWLNSGEKVAGR